MNNKIYFQGYVELNIYNKYSNKKSLILLDELGTGTDPNSSMAIAQSILEILNTKNCKIKQL